MHESVMKFVEECCEIIRPDDGELVVEIGSRNINGQAREVFKPWNVEYIGIDLIEGDGVDIVHDCTTLPLPAMNGKSEYFWNFVNVIVCCEVLEHVAQWDWMVASIKRMMMLPDSWLILTTRSPGFPRHEFPNDHWRFKMSDLLIAFSDFEIIRLEPDPQVSGVFMLARRPMVRLSDVHPEPAPPEAHE
jgi:hypothetical protein